MTKELITNKFEPTMDSSSDEYIMKLQLKAQEKDIEEIKVKLIDKFIALMSETFSNKALKNQYGDVSFFDVLTYLREHLKEIL